MPLRGSLFDEGAVVLAWLAPNADVDFDDKRTAIVALLSTPWPPGLNENIGTRHLSVATSAAVARRYLVSIPY